MNNKLEGRDYVRELVRVRDGHKCKSCKKAWKEGERRFDVHHLNGQCGKKSRLYDRISNIKNLITYCHSCHMGKHVNSSKFKRKGTLKASKVTQLRAKGKTFDEIAKVFGVKQSAVWVFCKTRGIPTSLDNISKV